MQRVIAEGMEKRETSLCGPQFLLMTPLSSFRPSLPLQPIMLSSLSPKPQNKMSPSGMAGRQAGRQAGDDAVAAADPVALPKVSI